MAVFDLFKRRKKVIKAEQESSEKINKNMDSDALKDSVFLPKTNFPMKANLTIKESEILQYWEKINLYERVRNKSKGRPKFILHYGPPYANGDIHIGHSLTEGVKDILVKIFQMSGYDSPLVPGWDCHGLPIEWKVEEDFRAQKKNKEDIPVIDFLGQCRSFAQKWIIAQKKSFIRLGILADWDNSYHTMDSKSEGVIVSEFLKIFSDGYIYRGKKPVMWSVVEKTALAEAEIEYEKYVSVSVYVSFPIASSGRESIVDSHVVIWTTTPWTLPANRAIAYHDDIIYVLICVKKVDVDVEKSVYVKRKFIVAKELCDVFCKTVGIIDFNIIDTFKGSVLAGTICKHPFSLYEKFSPAEKKSKLSYFFDVPLVSADHVTVEAGTGLVHTAPSHGLEDFGVGLKYGLDKPDIVKDDGTYVDDLPIFSGKHIFKVSNDIILTLRDCDALLATSKIEHSYPHSWRSKSPLIFRLTQQWFFNIDKLREKALEEIENVNWFPAQSKKRIYGMVETRPDWCLSRQRKWGVPIALFLNNETDEPLIDEKVNEKVIKTISEEGIEAWHKYDADYFLSSGEHKGKYHKVMDTLDVWFDSACTHHFVLENHPDLSWPADICFEGSDQHRGWFQSSLIEAIATKGKAPYKNVVTHGFVLDKNGHKMSKSLGNVTSCEEVIKKYGADLLRLWVVSSDNTEDVRIGQEILTRQEDIYRRLRNTLRYLLGAISGYDAKETFEYKELPEIEKYILHQLFKLHEKLQGCMKIFDFSTFYSDLHLFCSNDLSAFYFDIRKDSLYCDAKTSLKRKAAQYVMNKVFLHLSHWLAPVLSFTSEEAWQTYQDNNQESIHERLFCVPEETWQQNDLAEKWQKIRQVRRVITSAIEQERLAKTINSSLQAEVVLFATGTTANFLKDVDMSEVAIISGFKLSIAQPPAGAVTLDDVANVGAVVSKASGEKCPRCWKITNKTYGGSLCKRCFDIINSL